MTLAKEIVCRELCNIDVGGISVRRGRGTARRWIDIRTEIPIPDEIKDKIRQQLVSEGQAGTYWPDDGFGGADSACVLFERLWK